MPSQIRPTLITLTEQDYTNYLNINNQSQTYESILPLSKVTIIKQAQSSNDTGVPSISTKERINIKSRKTNRYNKKHRNRYHLAWYWRILIIILILLLIAAIIMIPVGLLVLRNTNIDTTTSTTTTIVSTNLLTNTTLTTTTSSSTSTTSTDSTTSITVTTSSSATITTTTPVSTITITSNICTINWTGIQLISQCVSCPTIPSYNTYSYTFTAISSTTIIVFAMQRQTGYFAMDDISVRSLLHPNIELLTNNGFETGNLTGWYYCNQNNAVNTGGVQTYNFTYNSSTYNPHSGSYYYVGGSTVSADYLLQTFPTTNGEVYNFSIWYMLASGGPLTSGVFFLGS